MRSKSNQNLNHLTMSCDNKDSPLIAFLIEICALTVMSDTFFEIATLDSRIDVANLLCSELYRGRGNRTSEDDCGEGREGDCEEKEDTSRGCSSKDGHR